MVDWCVYRKDSSVCWIKTLKKKLFIFTRMSAKVSFWHWIKVIIPQGKYQCDLCTSLRFRFEINETRLAECNLGIFFSQAHSSWTEGKHFHSYKHMATYIYIYMGTCTRTREYTRLSLLRTVSFPCFRCRVSCSRSRKLWRAHYFTSRLVSSSVCPSACQQMRKKVHDAQCKL